MAKPGLFILGGSSYYTLLLFKAMCALGLHHQLGRITLFGRNEARLRTIADCGSLLFEGGVLVDYTLQAEDFLASEYTLLFNQMRFGGLTSRNQDEKIALDIGLFADETLGIVGASNAVRSIVGIKPFLELMKQKTGNYQLVNFTNPCSIITEYIARDFSIPVIGVCDYPQMMRHAIARNYGAAPSDIDMRYFGVNHFGYIYDVKVKGEDKLAELRRTSLPFKPDCNRYFDTLLNISWHYLFEQDAVVEAQRNNVNRAETLLDIEAELDICVGNHGLQLHRLIAILEQRQCHWFELVVAPLFQSLLAGRVHQEYLNLACCNPLSPEQPTVIEANASLGNGCIQMDAFWGELAQGPEYFLVQQMKCSETQMLQAILSRDFDGVVKSCLMNPLIANKNKIIKYFDRLNKVDVDFFENFNS
jgi:6-phospho-beta-glucosidase